MFGLNERDVGRHADCSKDADKPLFDTITDGKDAKSHQNISRPMICQGIWMNGQVLQRKQREVVERHFGLAASSTLDGLPSRTGRSPASVSARSRWMR